MLYGAVLGSVRRAVGQLMPDVYSVLREVRTYDSEGGWTDVEATVSTGSCLLTEFTGGAAEQVVADRQAVQRPATAYLPLSADVTEGDRLACAGKTFDILAVFSGGEYSAVKHLVLSERL